MINDIFAEHKEKELKTMDSSPTAFHQGTSSDVDTSESEDIDERYQHLSNQSRDRYKHFIETSKYLFICFVSLGVVILFYMMLTASRGGERGTTHFTRTKTKITSYIKKKRL